MKGKETTLVLLLCSLVMLTGSGCCSIISGNKQKIPISSNPPGAKVTADNGTSIVTPGTLTLSTKIPHTLVAEYPGHEKQQQKLVKKLNNWIFLNILIDFGIISIPIDLISGAANELKPKEINFNFEEATEDTGSEENPEKVSILYREDEFEKCVDYWLSRIYKIAA